MCARARVASVGFALATAIAALINVLAAPAAAQTEGDERARMLFQAGTVYYQNGEYERALEQFETAYELSPRPILLYNIGLARERSGNPEGALEAFHGFLDSGVELPDVPRSSLERRVSALEARIARFREQQAEAQPEVATPEEAAQQATPARPFVTPAPASGGGDDGVVIGITLGAVGAVLVAAAIVLAIVFTQPSQEPYDGTLFSTRIP
ncbi:MAG: tetratricopeptide repeat protein [Sandaracinaceae bacterium]|nr:tetratricopeptide repeat protein [Sandaracinaceae bacterium]